MIQLNLTQRIILRYYKTKIKLLAKVSPQKAAEYTLQLFFTPYSKHTKMKRPAIFHKGEPLSFPFNGNTINGFRWKSHNMNAPTILVCHGMNSCSYRFEIYIQLLLQHNLNVYAFDAQGHGKSGGKFLNAVIYSELIEQIEIKYGPIDGIIAHSIAGLATTFAMERIQKHHKKLALIAPATETVTAIDNFFKIFGLSDEFRAVFDQTVHDVRGLPVSWYSATRAVQQINNPILWLHDEDDIICPYDDTSGIRQLQLPNIRFVTTKGLGHNNIYRDKDVQDKIIDFMVS